MHREVDICRERIVLRYSECFKREVVEAIIPSVRCMPTLINAELLLRVELNNLPIKQVHVRHRPRRFGVSRGLPPWTFLFEAYKAYRGLLRLKQEFVD